MEQDIIKKAIIELVRAEKNRPIPLKILINKFINKYKYKNEKEITSIINTLIEHQELKYLNDTNKIILGYINEKIFNDINLQGMISINTRGDGYIKEFDEQSKHVIKEWFVFNTNINGALDGDIVLFNPMDKFNKNNIQNAVVKKVITRSKTEYVGTFIKKDMQQYDIVIDNNKNYYQIKLDKINGLVDGNKILIKINEFDEKNKIAYGSVSKIIGHINDIDSDILSIVYDNGIKPNFDKEVEDALLNVKLFPQLESKRVDLTNRHYLTIDPASSKDLDDAIYVERINGDEFLLSVAIADVSSYVQFDSIIDKAAIKRCTSIYLADRVIPMLPHLISNDWCSLNPFEPKNTIVVDMIIDIKGNISNIDVKPAKIISKNRFSYDEVNDYFESKKQQSHVPKAIYQQLDKCLKLHHILRRKMEENGYIDFKIKEPIIVLDKNNKVTDIKIKVSKTAQKMIEDFMVAANQAVTIKADALNIPFIYRTHNQPSIEKLNRLDVEVKKFGFFINKKDFHNLTSKKVSDWIKNNNNNKIELISKLILRSMEKAQYQTSNTHHFGLALNKYTHFTSPIRRYADLMVHRLFWMYLFAKDYYSDAQRQSFTNQLNYLCHQCNLLEIRAIEIEREVNRIKFCEYMQSKINQVFDGIISSITTFGIFVEIKENGIEGLVRINKIGKDFYVYDEKKHTIVGARTNKTFSFGQDVQIRVVSVDKNNKQIDFELVGFENHDSNENKVFRKKLKTYLY